MKKSRIVLFALALIALVVSCEKETPTPSQTVNTEKLLVLDLFIENQIDATYTIKKNGQNMSANTFLVNTGDTVIISVDQNCWGGCGLISLVSSLDGQNIGTDFCSCPIYYKQLFIE